VQRGQITSNGEPNELVFILREDLTGRGKNWSEQKGRIVCLRFYMSFKKSYGFPETPKVANLYIGIDPGASGGIAIIWDGGSKAIKMPEEDMDILDFLLDLQGNIPLAPETVGINTHVCMEKVWGWVGGNKTQQPTKEKKSEGNPGSHMFQFGVNYGRVRMALRAVGMEPTLVAARTWQKGSRHRP
jgi:hypothetical protein